MSKLTISGVLERAPRQTKAQYFKGILVAIEPPVVLDQQMLDRAIVTESITTDEPPEYQAFSSARLIGSTATRTVFFAQFHGEWGRIPTQELGHTPHELEEAKEIIKNQTTMLLSLLGVEVSETTSAPHTITGLAK